MADLQLTVYANPHYAPDTQANPEEAYDRARDEALPWFTEATKDDLAKFRATMVSIAPYYNSPRWTRERDAAKAKYSKATADARLLLDLSIDELMASGEISQETAYRWDMLKSTTALKAAIDDAERVGVKWAWNEADERNLIDLHLSQMAAE